MTDDKDDGSQADLSRKTETSLRVVALHAATLADALLLARHHRPAEFSRMTRGWLLDTQSAAVAVERRFHVSVSRLDPTLALTVKDVASAIRAHNPDDH